MLKRTIEVACLCEGQSLASCFQKDGRELDWVQGAYGSNAILQKIHRAATENSSCAFLYLFPSEAANKAYLHLEVSVMSFTTCPHY